MPRLNTGWFEFKNEKSSDKGIRVMDPFSDSTGASRGDEETVLGRSGYIWLSDGAKEQFELKRVCQVRKSNKRTVQSWLRGDGPLRFSAEEDVQYSARIIKKIDFKQICAGDDPIYEFTVTFTVQPHPYLYPPAETTEIFASGTPIPMPDNVFGTPRVEIHGRGDFSLTIGMETLFFTGVKNGIIVDSELMDAFDLDGAALLNDHFTGMPYEIQPGMNTVSWLLDNGASIERVVITPRWRYL